MKITKTYSEKKLFELESELPIKVICECNDGSKYITVHHLDGTYSYCIPEKEEGKKKTNPVHLAVLEPLIKVKKGVYKLTPKK